MIKLEKYDGTKTYMFPNGALADKDTVLSKVPAALTFTHVIETDENGEVMLAIQNLSALRTFNKIDKSLTDDEAIEKIQELRNASLEPVQEPVSAEERIASALEYQILSSMPDNEE